MRFYFRTANESDGGKEASSRGAFSGPSGSTIIGTPDGYSTSRTEGAFIYIRTSGDDGACEKLGVDVQRAACNSTARHLGFELTGEFLDDGVSGKVPMHSRPQGKRMMTYLLANGTKPIITYDGKRIGRTQPVYWAFIGMARDNDIRVLDKDGKNLCESVQGGIEGLMSELDHTATVARKTSKSSAGLGTE
jgi:hypothetical protein